MTNSNGAWSAAPFPLLDTGDEKGVRAEVKVYKGFGTVTNIKPAPNGRSANILVNAGGKYDMGGWMNMDEEAFKIAQEAFESGKMVYFRIESQRKNNVDRTLPIAEITLNTDIARENTRRIFVGVGFTEPVTLTKEALTNPDEDPNTGGSKVEGILSKQRATPSDMPATQNNQVANAPRSNTVDSNRSFSREEASYKTYNSDGRFNLGSAAFAAAVSAEQFARDLFRAQMMQGDTEAGILTLARGILRAADHVQASVYGGDYKVDRSSGSHTRARGIIYDTIREYLPLNLTKTDVESDEFDTWVEEVQGFASKRMKTAFALATEGDETITPSGDAVVDAPQYPSQQASAVNTAEPTSSESSYPDFIYIVGDDIPTDGERTTQDTLEALKALVEETQITDTGALGTLMEISTGVRKALENADEVVGDFIDHYTTDPDSLVEAVNWVAQNINNRKQ